MKIDSKKTILFIGDSITDHGRDYADGRHTGWGYVRRVADKLEAAYPGITVLNRGISGNRVCDLEARWDEDCIALKPDILSVMIGINDTWRHFDSGDETSAEDFYKCYKRIMLRVREELPGTEILIIQPYLLHHPQDRLLWEEDFSGKLSAVGKIMEEFAEYRIYMNDIFRTKAQSTPPWELADDGVHPTDMGCDLIAEQVLIQFDLK